MIRIHPTIIKLFSNYLHPVGEYYETSNLNFNPNFEWWGTWNLEEDGTVLVSKSNSSNSSFNSSISSIIGEENHVLTTDEMPAHSHRLKTIFPFTAGGGQTGLPNSNSSSYNSEDWQTCNSAGGSQPHNNIQPSKIVNRWHRVS